MILLVTGKEKKLNLVLKIAQMKENNVLGRYLLAETFGVSRKQMCCSTLSKDEILLAAWEIHRWHCPTYRLCPSSKWCAVSRPSRWIFLCSTTFETNHHAFCLEITDVTDRCYVPRTHPTSCLRTNCVKNRVMHIFALRKWVSTG